MIGASIRSLAQQYHRSVGSVANQITREMDALPANEWLSQIYCNRWGGVLNLDGTYIAVKGYDKKIPAIYGVDFTTRDIPAGIMAPSENTESFNRFFALLKAAHYPLKVVISDDVPALRAAMTRKYPDARIQLCHMHITKSAGHYQKRQDIYSIFGGY